MRPNQGSGSARRSTPRALPASQAHTLFRARCSLFQRHLSLPTLQFLLTQHLCPAQLGSDSSLQPGAFAPTSLSFTATSHIANAALHSFSFALRSRNSIQSLVCQVSDMLMTPTYSPPPRRILFHPSKHRQPSRIIDQYLTIQTETSDIYFRDKPPCPTQTMSSSARPLGHRYSVSTPTKPSPLRTEITEEMDSLEIDDGERTPTQESYAREYPSIFHSLAPARSLPQMVTGTVFATHTLYAYHLSRHSCYHAVLKQPPPLSTPTADELANQPSPFIDLASDSDDDAPDTPTPVRPVHGQGGIVVGGMIRKSASTMDLRALAEDDVFGPTFAATTSSVPGLLNVANTHPSKQAIDTINRNTAAQYKAVGYGGYMPREDRGLVPNTNNAQGLFHPDANVFVAKSVHCLPIATYTNCVAASPAHCPRTSSSSLVIPSSTSMVRTTLRSRAIRTTIHSRWSNSR